MSHINNRIGSFFKKWATVYNYFLGIQQLSMIVLSLIHYSITFFVILFGRGFDPAVTFPF